MTRRQQTSTPAPNTTLSRTQTDTCQNGSCVGANPVVCTADQCHDPGTCNPATGVCSAPTNKTNGTACNDGDACTQTGSAQNRERVEATPVAGSAKKKNNPRNSNPATTLSSAAPNKNNSTTANNGGACWPTNSCQKRSCGGGRPVVCSADDQCHDPGTCNPVTGMCSAPTNKTNGTACNDGDACT